jgi:hypothetical protein
MDIESLSPEKIEAAISRLKALKAERKAERLDRLKGLRGAEFIETALRIEWLSWMRAPGLREAMQRATSATDIDAADCCSDVAWYPDVLEPLPHGRHWYLSLR